MYFCSTIPKKLKFVETVSLSNNPTRRQPIPANCLQQASSRGRVSKTQESTHKQNMSAPSFSLNNKSKGRQ